MMVLRQKTTVCLALVVLSAFAIITWAFLSKNMNAATEGKETEKKIEKEIEVKVLDKDKPDNDRTSVREQKRTEDRYDSIFREFEQTQREMQEIIDRLRKDQERIMKELWSGEDQPDFPRRDDWSVSPRFRALVRDPWSGMFPDEKMFRGWGDFMPPRRTDELYTSMDIQEDIEHIVIKLDIPGMEEEKIDIILTGRILSIKGDREIVREESNEEGRVIVHERSSRSFERRISLPKNINPDKIKSTYKDGVLTITFSKIVSGEPAERKIIIETR